MTIHSCSYYCARPECIKAQRDDLRDRLAQPEQESCGWQFYAAGKWHNGMEANDHRVNTEAAGIPTRNVYPGPVAQPEQEPVAWMVIGDGEYGEYTPGMHFDAVGYKEYWERRGYELQPLYTAPPKRKPLTDVELADLWYKQSLDWLEFGRAIEAAHGIKGEA